MLGLIPGRRPHYPPPRLPPPDRDRPAPCGSWSGVAGRAPGRAAGPASALWTFRLRAGRDSERRVQPRQTDAVDQFVSREANGYKA